MAYDGYYGVDVEYDGAAEEEYEGVGGWGEAYDATLEEPEWGMRPILCANGSSCRFLAMGVCRYYHSAEEWECVGVQAAGPQVLRQPVAAPHRKRPWNVLVLTPEGSKFAGESQARVDSPRREGREVEGGRRSRSPRRQGRRPSLTPAGARATTDLAATPLEPPPGIF